MDGALHINTNHVDYAEFCENAKSFMCAYDDDDRLELDSTWNWTRISRPNT